ncbi:histidine phosphatase family protein [Paenibacillus montanisoli]|uniref:Histidine phosphatase family protein n=2 Tax=Paenibacillus montanisoli TaxID=2081970 RepID=A0A328TWT2_9BACL|nr:histidine phosphatase family protein [Paenibacillus montanisoli]
MIRHAESSYSPGKDRTRGLSPKGQEDVLRVTELLRDTRIDEVVSSPYARALLTVEGIAAERGLPVMQFEELRERKLHGDEVAFASGGFLDAIERSFADHKAALPGGESFREAQQRAVQVVKRLLQAYGGQSVAVGTHGNIMCMILHAFDSRYGGFDFWKRTTMPDVYRMTFRDEELVGFDRLWS